MHIKFVIRLTHANVWESMELIKSRIFLLQVMQQSVSGQCATSERAMKLKVRTLSP